MALAILRCLRLLGAFLQRNRVHAITQPTRLRAIWKHMSKMRIASIANGFNPSHPKRAVHVVGNRVRRHGLRERGPTGARLKLLGRIKQQRVATQARIEAWLQKTTHFRTECALCPRLTCDAILLGAELLPPFGVGLDHFVIRRRIAFF